MPDILYNDDFNSYAKYMLKLKNYESNYLKILYEIMIVYNKF